MTLPDGRTGQALALAIAAGLLAVAYLSIVQPLLGAYGGMREELADLTMQRSHLEKIASEVPRLQSAVEAMKRSAADTGLWLSDPSDAVAAASLQTRLQRLAAAEGAEVSSVESLSPKVQDAFHRVGVRTTLTGDLAALTGIVRGLTTSQPPLFVENLDVRNNGLTSRQMPDRPPPLNISFDVYGFRLEEPQQVVAR